MAPGPETRATWFLPRLRLRSSLSSTVIPGLFSVIVGFNPTIHAMTAQKHCPQNRPSA
jgi:hypothetical protein